MPIAVAFAKKVDVIGFDLNKNKIEQYKNGVDPTNEVGDDAIKQTTVDFTSDETKLREDKVPYCGSSYSDKFRQNSRPYSSCRS